VETAVTFLVTRFVPLIPNDLEGWMANPEEWVNTEDKDDEQWQFELRVSLKMPPICVFLRESIAMCRACSHDFCEPVSRVRHPTTREGIRQCQWYEAATRRGLLLRKVEERPPASLQDIVQKEAVYCAIGRCAHRLRDDLNLSSWMETAKNEAKNPSAEYVRSDIAPRIC
jgi:hypothetical protein